jgi:hypothetical protein
MRTASGRSVTMHHGAPSIEDIALGLSRQPRFGGQTRKPWSVLQHSMVCVFLARDTKQSARMQLLCLLHDAHESIMGDVPTDLKTFGTKALQYDLDRRIYLELGLVPPTHEEQGIIAHYDFRSFLAEAEAVGPEGFPVRDYGVPTGQEEATVRTVLGLFGDPADFLNEYHYLLSLSGARLP